MYDEYKAFVLCLRFWRLALASEVCRYQPIRGLHLGREARVAQTAWGWIDPLNKWLPTTEGGMEGTKPCTLGDLLSNQYGAAELLL